jgi:hypothetical protein
MARPRTKPHPGELSRMELVAAIALLKPKARVAPTDEALAASTAKRLETMAAAKAERVAEVAAARAAVEAQVAAWRSGAKPEGEQSRIGRDDYSEGLRRLWLAGRFR